MSKTALITGVSGQDGAYLARLLVDHGYRVVGTTRNLASDPARHLARLGLGESVQLEVLGMDDYPSVEQLLRRVLPDEIYHLAGQSSVGVSFARPRETFTAIGMSTLNVLEAIRQVGRPVRFFNASSSECFGDTGAAAADERTPFRPQSPYAVAKAASFWQTSNYRDAYGLFACSGILFNHESPLRDERFVTKKIVAAACRIASGSNEQLHLGDLSMQRDWGWAPEYVEAMWLMLQQDSPEDFVIATGQTEPLAAFVEQAFHCLGLEWQEHVHADASLRRPLDIPRSCANPDKALKQLGWHARSAMRDVVHMMIDDHRKMVSV